ncbi:putative ATPase, F1/V1/A1 complex, alpha/beta subunit, zinc knuckle CX2CX4HX4C containing protein [Tanacetum coccineum]
MPISDKTLVGYFINHKMAFPDVDYHLKRMWKRFVVMDDNGFIFINFNNEVNLTHVLNNGPCFIRNVPIFLQQWNPQMVLKKLDQEMVTMCVKLHHIPSEVYSVDGLSRLASAIGVPLIPDRLTEKMLKAYDEGNTFAKVLVQVKADKDLKDSIVVRFPFGPFKELVYTEVDVEYEWKPARCGTCLVFGHDPARIYSVQDPRNRNNFKM